MSLWQSLFGTKTHCAGCGAVVPGVDPRPGEDVYCSEVCRANVVRLSTIPPARAVPKTDDEQHRPIDEPLQR
jgi:hypothetical protein